MHRGLLLQYENLFDTKNRILQLTVNRIRNNAYPQLIVWIFFFSYVIRTFKYCRISTVTRATCILIDVYI